MWVPHTRHWSSREQIKSDQLEKKRSLFLIFLLLVKSQCLLSSEMLSNNLLELCSMLLFAFFTWIPNSCYNWKKVAVGRNFLVQPTAGGQDNFEIRSGCSEPCPVQLEKFQMSGSPLGNLFGPLREDLFFLVPKGNVPFCVLQLLPFYCTYDKWVNCLNYISAIVDTNTLG